MFVEVIQLVLASVVVVELFDAFVSGACLLEDETFFRVSLDDVAFDDGVLDEGFCSITLEDETPDIATSRMMINYYMIRRMMYMNQRGQVLALLH